MPVYGNKITDYLRTVLTGAGRPSVGVSVRKHTGDTEVVATTTDGNGKFTASFADGSPGPVYYRTTDGGDTRTHSGQSTGQVGTFFASSLPNIFQVFSDGYITGVGGGCAPSATGAGMTVTVADGVVLAAGHPYPRTASGTVTITAAHATLPRIDLVVVRLYVPGTAEEGRMELVVKAGTAAASPVSPTVQQDATYWEVAIAQVAVDAAVTSIASGKVTDVRSAAGLKPPIIFNSDSANTLLVEKTSATDFSAGAGGVDVLRVNNSGTVPVVQFPMGTILRGFSDAYAAETWELDSGFGVLQLNGRSIKSGTQANPEGLVIGDPGSLYLSSSGTIFRKSSGTSTTGWVSLSAAATTYATLTGDYHREGGTTHSFTSTAADGVDLLNDTGTTWTVTIGPLVSGIEYDVECWCLLRHAPASTAYRSTHAVWVNGARSVFIGTTIAGNHIARRYFTMTGAGATLSATVRGRLTSAGSADYTAGVLVLTAHPRR